MTIKNIALAGHAGTGKTTLLEALLYQGGCVERMGSVAAGTTVSDDSTNVANTSTKEL